MFKDGFRARKTLRGLAFLVLGSMLPGAASAVTVDFGGQLYEVSLLTAAPTATYGDIATTVESNSPWFGDTSFALGFANTYQAATEGTRTASTYFAFQNTLLPPFGTITSAYELPTAGPISPTQPLFASVTDVGGFTFATAVAVPEINGPVLAKLAFILMVLYVVLSVRRKRRQVVFQT